jgi:hypothetical protein
MNSVKDDTQPKETNCNSSQSSNMSLVFQVPEQVGRYNERDI